MAANPDSDETMESGPQKRRGQGKALQNLQNQVARKTGPALPALPTGTAHQVELLLAMRRNRLRGFLFRIGVFVLLPSFCVWVYTALIATPRYVCHFEITYQAYEADATLAGGLTQSQVGSSMTDSIDYGTLLYEYVRSPGLAAQVDKAMDLRGVFSSGKIDWMSRLPRHATQAQFLKSWRDHVSVSEGFGGYLTVDVQGFDPQFTLQLAQAINTDADAMIDGLTARARQAEVAAATSQLAIASTALASANDALTGFRNAHGDLDPSFAATQLGTIVGTLESQLATLRAQLSQAQANMQPGNPQIVQLNLQIAAVQNQIAAEHQRLAATGQTSYADTVAAYENLLANQQLANSTQQAAQQGLVIAQADSARKQNYVVDFVPPILPDEPTAPNPLTATATAFAALLCVYGIFNLLFAAFRDQAGL